MLLTVDIGNTNIVLALFDGRDFVKTFRIYSDQKKTSDEYMVIIESLLKDDKFCVSNAIISSVVPNLTRSIQKIVYNLFNIDAMMVSHDLKTGLVRESIPHELGSDLLSNLSYAHHVFPSDNVIVVDFGTALTLSTVNRKAEVLGVAIAPGLVTAVNSLFSNTAQLPQVELKIPKSALGRDSMESIRSGIMLGYSGLVKALIENTEKEIGESVKVIATGGLSKVISPLIERFDIIDGYHTLKGLALIHSLNS